MEWHGLTGDESSGKGNNESCAVVIESAVCHCRQFVSIHLSAETAWSCR
jgi:hypothetical protein